MARLLLHIGTHKTGSTALQHWLRDNAPALSERGILYPRRGLAAGQHWLVPHYRDTPLRRLSGRSALQNWDRLATRLKGSDWNVIISSEEFSRLNTGPAASLAQIRDALAAFDRVDVLCALRDQVGLLQSAFTQICRQRPMPSWAASYQEAMEQGTFNGLALDYNLLYDMLLTQFDPDQIRFCAYDGDLMAPDGLVAAISAWAGQDLAALPRPVDTHNPSSDPLATWLAGFAAAPKPAPHGLIAEITAELRVSLPDGTRTTLYARPEPQNLAERFAPDNARLGERIAPHQGAFHWPEMPITNAHAHRGQLPFDFWLRLSKRLVGHHLNGGGNWETLAA